MRQQPAPDINAQLGAARKAAKFLNEQFRETVNEPIQRALQVLPDEVSKFQLRTETLTRWISAKKRSIKELTPNDIFHPAGEDSDFPLLKLALRVWRRARAFELEGPRSITTDPKVVLHYDDELEVLDWLIKHDGLRQTQVAALPRLSDYMSIHRARELIGATELPPPPKYDQKFGILLSPDRVSSDFQFFRTECDARDVPTTFAFVDIDDFKSYNTEYGHTAVDYDLLPQFQQAIEAHVYHRGRAYREGGDEYVIILPNMSKEQASAHMERLQEQLRRIEYRLRDLKGKPTVSIGIVTVTPTSLATTREIRETATGALKAAKVAGKNRIESRLSE